MARGPESLASLLRSIVRDVEVATPTPTATDHDCDKCKDEHYYYVETRPREGHNSGAGLWERCDCDGSVRAQLKAAQLMEDDQIPPGIGAFDPTRQELDAAAHHEALAAVKHWIAGEVRNLILIGPVGVGKTHLAKAAIANVALNGRGATFLRAGTFYRRMMDFDSSRESRMKWLDQIAHSPALALDDLGAAQTGNDEILGRLEDLTDRRYEITGSQTLVTTNLLPEELEKAIGVRSFDRLRSGGETHMMPGRSQR